MTPSVRRYGATRYTPGVGVTLDPPPVQRPPPTIIEQAGPKPSHLLVAALLCISGGVGLLWWVTR
jgi:hypothetical protein